MTQMHCRWKWIMVLAVAFCICCVYGKAQDRETVKHLEIRILSTMVSEEGLGEWGFSALVTVDGHKILFDTGKHDDIVLRNLRSLNLSLVDVPEVVLSHHHSDHIGGFVALRRDALKSNPGALATTYVAKGFFDDRKVDGELLTGVRKAREDYDATGGKWAEIDHPRQLYPGVWLTGPVPRKYPERNWDGRQMIVQKDGSLIEDTLPEDQALVINTAKGLVVLTGCGHAGIVNIVDYAQHKIVQRRLYAVVGGIHLYNADQKTIRWTSSKLKTAGIRRLIGAHCTGIDTLYEMRQLLGLNRKTATVGPIGSIFAVDEDQRHGSGQH